MQSPGGNLRGSAVNLGGAWLLSRPAVAAAAGPTARGAAVIAGAAAAARATLPSGAVVVHRSAIDRLGFDDLHAGAAGALRPSTVTFSPTVRSAWLPGRRWTKAPVSSWRR